MAHIDDPRTQRANLTFIKNSMNEPLLEREVEFELARRWREEGDEEALHKLVRSYMRLVISTASRFRNYGLPVGDLVQEGNVGLMQAAARFEPQREVRFSTYAAWWIRSAIQEYVLRNWSIVRTGSTAMQKALFFNLRRLRAQIGSGGEHLPFEVRERIAGLLRVEIGEVEAMESRLASNDRSLNTPIGENGDSELVDHLADDAADPETVVREHHDAALRARWIAEAVSNLSEREQTIIRARRLSEDAATLESLGKRLGISKERVRQIEHQAIRKLRVLLEGRREAIV